MIFTSFNALLRVARKELRKRRSTEAFLHGRNSTVSGACEVKALMPAPTPLRFA
jgi:hypothetical protein